MDQHVIRNELAHWLAPSLYKRCGSALRSCWAGWILCAALCVACDSTSHAPLHHQMYIWQRAWKPEVRKAMAELGPSVSGWHVLVTESDALGRWAVFVPELSAPRGSGLGMTAVVRIDGSRLLADSGWLAARVKGWLDSQPAGRWSGLEIDYDCPNRQLPVYARFLQSLRTVLPSGMTLSVTALPAWIGESSLHDVLKLTDRSVLQVHSVLDPHRGLFDPTLAAKWIAAYSKVSPRPFEVALPDYGSRVSWDDRGRLVAVTSEGPENWLPGSVELDSDPRQVAAFVALLAQSHPGNLAGFVWFRLPLESDRRIWSIQTLASVIGGQPLIPGFAVSVERDGQGAYHLVLNNTGTVDTDLPQIVHVDGSCQAADGSGLYTVSHEGGELVFERRQVRKLRVGQRAGVGWTHCELGREDVHLED